MSSPPLSLLVDAPGALPETVTALVDGELAQRSMVQLSGCSVVLWLSAEHATRHRVSLPELPAARLQPLLPAALEDRLLQPYAHYQVSVQSNRSVVTVAREWLDALLTQLRAQHIQVSAVYALPASDTGWRCVDLGAGRLQLSHPQQGDAVLAAEEAEALLGGDEAQSVSLTTLLQTTPPASDALIRLRDQNTPAHDWRQWRTAAVLLLAIATLLVVSRAHEVWQLSRQKTALTQELRQTFAAALPGVPIVDPVLQIESKVREAGVSHSVDPVQALLHRLDGALPAASVLSALDYDGSALTLTTEGDAAALADAAKQAGLTVEHTGQTVRVSP
ncbi:type II secretion system protein GspL [Chitinibacteraceae bacterium HSL-7]